MIWRFTIIDRDNEETVIDEPVGWDSSSAEIKRDLEWHGIFFASQGETLEFYDDAMRILKAEWNKYKYESIMYLLIEEDCGNGFIEYARGRFDFGRYEYICGPACYVKIPIEKSDEVMTLRNRLNQKVNLEAVKAFDETTDLNPYSHLPFELQLPSKGIKLFNDSFNEELNKTPVWAFTGVPITGGEWNTTWGTLELGFTKTKAAEIGSYETNNQPLYTGFEFADINTFTYTPLNYQVNVLVGSPILNYHEASPNFGTLDSVDFNMRVKGRLKELNSGRIDNICFFLLMLAEGKEGTSESDFDILHVVDIPANSVIGVESPYEFDISFANPTLALSTKRKERIYAFFSVYSSQLTSEVDGTGDIKDTFEIEYDTESFIRMEAISKTAMSPAKVFMVNESLSRVVEAITNDRLRCYSDYFGRTDSQPYSHPIDGCGSLEVITDGIRLREQENRVPESPSLFTASLQDLWEGLSPIHNIGMGIELDENRPGYNRLRVESFRHFYNDTVIMSCVGIETINRRANEKDALSTFQIGYQKWEAEEYTGLDELLTKRTYRTSLSQLKSDLSKLSKFVASGYALEITRRKGNDSKDWRYDKDTFIICLKRGEEESFQVELGNITAAENIIDPDTIYNYRISPARNALKWLPRLLQSYSHFGEEAKIIFTDGDANYQAAGLMTSEECRNEEELLSESQTLTVLVSANPEQLLPILSPERVVYDYPMNSLAYRMIQQNPYGQIYFESECERGYGYIDTIVHRSKEGNATFTLIPKIEDYGVH